VAITAGEADGLLRRSAMGNLSCSVSGLGAGDASRKSLRGSTRSCQRRRAPSWCHHYANNWLVGFQNRAKVAAQREEGQATDNQVAASILSLEELLNDCAQLDAQNVDLDVASRCVSPGTDAGSTEGSDEGDGESSGGYCYGYLQQMVTSVRDETDDEDDEDDVVLCKEDQAMMLLKTPTTICGEEWINWMALCPCCRRDASDDSIDLQEMIKLEPIRVTTHLILLHFYRNCPIHFLTSPSYICSVMIAWRTE